MQVALRTSMQRPLLLLAALGSFAACGGNGDDDGEVGDFVTVTAVTPARGPIAGGNLVTVTGSGFTLGGAERNQVLVGGALADAVSVLSDTTIEILVPSAAEAGDVGITIFNGNGTAALGNVYSYNPQPTLTALAPDVGDIQGGDTITLTGSGFADLEPGTNRVFFGDAEASDITANSDTSLTVVAPAGQVGRASQLRVENENGETGPLEYRYQSDGLLAFGYEQRGGPVASATGPVTARPGEVFHIDPISQTMEPTEARFRGPDDSEVTVCRGAAFDESGIYARLRDGVLGRLNFDDGTTDVLSPLAGCNNRLHALTVHQGELFGFCRDNDAGQDFGRIDPVARTFTPIGALDECCQINLVSDGTTMYLRVNSQFSSINPLTGVRGPILNLTGAASNMRGMAFAGGQLYILSTSLSGGPGSTSTFLYTLDPNTGASDFVMTLGTGLRAISSAK